MMLNGGSVGQWWPHETHSFVEGAATSVIEPRTGGRFYQKSLDGKSEYTIGEVLAYKPGERVKVTWKHSEEPNPTEVEVLFTPEGSGTRIELIHSGWERIGNKQMSSGYDSGWDEVLGHFTKFVGK